ncbi:hypothetical protein DRQ09_04835, partial [candidate division KSB1 bacterium]
MKIKLISFDLWNTLIIYNKNSIRKKMRINYILEIIKHYKDVTYEDVENAYEEAYNELDRIWMMSSRTPPPEEYLEILGSILGIKFSSREIKDITDFIQKTVTDIPPGLMKGAKKILDELSKKYTLALISNTGITIGDTLRKILKMKGILKNFSLTLFSNETIYGKPHPVVFEKLLNYFNVSPENVIHIGDNEYADIVGAKNAGMYTILFTKNKNEKTTADFTIKSLYEIPEKLKVLYL